MKKQSLLWALALILSIAALACKNTKETSESETHTEQSAVAEQAEETTQATKPGAEMEPVQTLQKDVTQDQSDSLFIRYERTACFGRCPIFNVKIYESGYMVYNGINFVNNIGKYYGRLDVQQIRSLKQTIDTIDYFSFEQEYDNPNVTDLPSVVTYVSVDGKQKEIRNRYRGPQELQKFYEKLDLFLDTTLWKPMETKE